MGTADELLELMFSWMKQRELCAKELKKLARELESLREKCNAADCVGSVYSVVGSACLLGAGGLTLLTGGAAAPLLLTVGSVVGGAGLTLQVGSKLTEEFCSSSTMKEAESQNQESSTISEKIQELYQKLKNERMETKPSADPDELEHHVMAEIVTAMARRRGLKKPINLRYLHGSFSVGQHRKMQVLTHTLAITYAGVLAFFSLKTGGKKFEILLAEGARRLAMKMSSVGLKAVMKGGALAVGAAVGMVFALKEAIDSWTELIEKNHVTEASQSLRDTADTLDKMNRMLGEQLEQIQEVLEEMVDNNEEEDDEENEKEEENEQEEDEEESESGERDQEHEDEDENEEDTEDDERNEDEDENEESDENEEDTEDDESNEEKDDEESSDVNATPVKVGLQNVCSAKHKMSKIGNLITQNGLDALLTCETWLQRDNEDAVLQQNLPEGFDYYHRPRGRRGGGVGVHFHRGLMHEWLTHRHQFHITTFEFMGILLTHPQWNEPVLVINVYRRPGGNLVQFDEFMRDFQMLLDAVYEEHPSIVLVGDFNIWVDDERRTRTRRFLDFLGGYGFNQYVEGSTQRYGHTLDLVIGRNVEIPEPSIWNHHISDHFTVIFTIRPIPRKRKGPKKRQSKRLQK
ncbi:uncharacterized protein LOC114468093 [Gouania willdenowi]|uniref:uncharacterized protein LOC114468093 n=1 Tax=Gouania willdenowi TaxID=441366 RepID=UPI00105696A5|nr:uncharacterized protein LOC114468093 [Gouania willdenowi]